MNLEEVFDLFTLGVFSGALFTIAPVFVGYMFDVFVRLMSKAK